MGREGRGRVTAATAAVAKCGVTQRLIFHCVSNCRSSLSLSLSIRPKRISMEASQARPGAANGNGMEVAARQSSSGGETENGRVGV